jgi:superfamily II DNA or RNA helicase
VPLTDYHAKYFAHELTRRCSSESVEKLASALADAQVDLNPHQIEAALFAFQNPLSRGAILADEVGLGKTIEAGLLLSQKWAERKRKLLVIVPANLRKQWSQELADKFHLPSAILETRTFNEAVRKGNLNPFDQAAVILCSYQFARTKDAYVKQTAWDLVVVDEAHRLRNVYKPTNKIANAIKAAVAEVPKVLLTATPLQNSLLELYGLVSVIDDRVFGDLESFRGQFLRISDPPAAPASASGDYDWLRNTESKLRKPILWIREAARAEGGRLRLKSGVVQLAWKESFPELDLEKIVAEGAARKAFETDGAGTVALKDALRMPSDPTDSFSALRARLAPICKRTLRRQVLEYVPFTDRHALVQEFYPTEQEQRLYDLVSDYLQQPTLYALPASQRQLMTLILRKLLASSTHAIAGTLDGLVHKLEAAEAEASAVDTPPDDLPADVEQLDELMDEWDDDEIAPDAAKRKLTPAQLDELRREMQQLREFHALAQSIIRNSKGEVLLTALRRAFMAATEAQRAKGAATLQPKAVIFTESRRTQEYLLKVLEADFGGKVMLFNGTNSDPASKAIYQRWLKRHEGTDRISGSPSADMRAALVDHFRDEATILIATEAAAEGINLQFCNVVVNYDLPWNPQRIEQRIGRCHRYGQKFDVVVVNFLNKKNAADQRVYELLDQKFRLFSGVFGASDEVLGAVESGVDFEKRIAAIYQKCRTPQQIVFEFDELQRELESEISEGQRDAREKLLNNFDQDVIERVRIQSHDVLDRFNERLWLVTRHLLQDDASFGSDDYSFTLVRNPFPAETIHPGPYKMGKAVDDVNTFRVGHPLAQHLLERAGGLVLPSRRLTFQYSGGGKNIAVVQSLVGKCGWLRAEKLTTNSFEPEDHMLLIGITDGGVALDDAQCRRLFDLSAVAHEEVEPADPIVSGLKDGSGAAERPIMEALSARNGRWFDAEMEKLDRWADDRRVTLKTELDQLDDRIKDTRKAARFAPNLPEKLDRQREVKRLETRRDEAWRDYDHASREVDRQKDGLLDEVGRRMLTYVERQELFTVRWEVV